MQTGSWQQRLAEIGIIGVLFSQLAFSAVTYYFNVAHPAWPFWILVGAISAALAVTNIAQIRFRAADTLFASFVGLVITSFVLAGYSSSQEFSQRLFLWCVGPYLCGRVLGNYARFPLLRGLYAVAALYLILIGIEFIQRPELFGASDRFYLFPVEDQGIGGGGDPTQYNIGLTLGATWVISLAALIVGGRSNVLSQGSRRRLHLIAVVVVIPVTLLVAGSRNSIVAMLMTAAVVAAMASSVSWIKKVGWLGTAIVIFSVVFPFLPEARQTFLDEITTAFGALGSFSTTMSSCSDADGSILNRVVLLNEAWRLFNTAPLLGIGAGNFGLQWCGSPTEFGGPHSIMFQVLAEEGVVGTTLFLSLIIVIFRSFSRRAKATAISESGDVWGVFAVWVFVFIQTQFSGNMFYDFHLFLLSGLLVSYATDYGIGAPATIRAGESAPMRKGWTAAEFEPRAS